MFSVLPVCCTLKEVLTRVTFKTLAGRRSPTPDVEYRKAFRNHAHIYVFVSCLWLTMSFDFERILVEKKISCLLNPLYELTFGEPVRYNGYTSRISHKIGVSVLSSIQ